MVMVVLIEILQVSVEVNNGDSFESKWYRLHLDCFCECVCKYCDDHHMFVPEYNKCLTACLVYCSALHRP